MKDNSIKLQVYHLPETRSERVLWAAYELGLESSMTVKTLDYLKGELQSDEMKRLNPLLKVPVMVLTDTKGKQYTMTESCAIPGLLSELCNDKFAPPQDDIFSRATYHRAIMVVAASLDSMVEAVLINDCVDVPGKEKDVAAGKKGRADFKEKGILAIKQMLGDNQYICGPDHDEFTMADVVLAWMLWVAERCEMLEEEPVLKAYLRRCLDRPAWKKVRGL